MVLSFKPQFEAKILDGSKIHTIRKDPKRRWKRGNKIHAATGVRSKNYNCFFEGECKGVSRIYIYPIQKRIIICGVGGISLHQLHTDEEIEIFAKNDGFETVEQFWAWFSEYFEGVLISWTDHKYVS